MNEVSCRAFSFFQAAAAEGWISLDQLLEGSRLERARLEDPAQRADWDDWAKLCDRFGDLIGHHRLRESARFAMQPSFAGAVISRIVPLLTSPLQLYKMGLEWGGASLYRCVTFSVQSTSDGRIRVTARLAPGSRPSRAWFEMLAGSAALLPTFVGFKPAVTEATVSDDSAEIFVTVPQSKMRLWLRRVGAALFAPGGVAAELASQQRQLLDTFQELNQRERAVFEMLSRMPAAVALFSEGRTVYANPSFAEVLGLPVSEVLARDVMALIVPEDAERFRQAVLQGPVDRPALVRFQAGGAERTLRVSPLESVAYGGALARGMFAIDLTEELRAKQSLQHHQETLAAVSVAIPDVIARVSADGVVLDVFGGGSLGAAYADAVRGRSLSTLVGTQADFTVVHLERLQAGIRASLDQRAPHTVELAGAAAQQVFECTIAPIEDHAEVLIVARDISRRRQQERELAVSERMASLGTLAAGLGHEINNPLTYVLANQHALLAQLDQLAAGAAPDWAEVRAHLTETLAGAERVRDIVKDLRAFSRVDQASHGTTALEPAIEEALRMVGHQLRHQAKAVTEFGGAGQVKGDHSRLVQLFVNLLVNAAQALGANRAADSAIVVRTRRQGGQVLAEVEDNGPGIAPQHLGRIFDPFFTTKPAGEGTGLGLAIVHRIMGESGGAVAVESVLGRGTTMRLTFTGAEAVQAPPPAAPAAGPRAARRVLLVDDEPMVLKAVARALRDFEVVSCLGGEQAIAVLQRDVAFDAVLCDLNMPGRDGIDVYRAARAASPALEQRFLFMTGGVFTERSRTFLEATRPPLLEKPALPGEVVSRLEGVLAAAEGRASTGAA